MVTLTKAEKAKVERCVKRIKKQQRAGRRLKVNPFAVCTASVLKQRPKKFPGRQQRPRTKSGRFRKKRR